jgi:hypothetical protein
MKLKLDITQAPASTLACLVTTNMTEYQKHTLAAQEAYNNLREICLEEDRRSIDLSVMYPDAGVPNEL